MIEKIINALKSVEDFEELKNAKEISIKVIDENAVEIEAELCDEERIVIKDYNEDTKMNKVTQQPFNTDKLFRQLIDMDKISRGATEIIETLEEAEYLDEHSIESFNDALEVASDITEKKYYIKIVKR